MKKNIIISLVAILIAIFTTGNVQAAKKLVVGTNAAYAPFEFVDDSGKIVGLDPDLITAVAKQAGYEVEIKDMDFDGLIPAVGLNQIDVIAAGLVITKERQKKVSYTQAYSDESLVLVVKESENNIKTLKDLQGKSIGVETGTTSADIANGVKGAKVVNLDSSTVFVHLVEGKVDAIKQTEAVAKYYINVTNKNNKLKIVGDSLVKKNANLIAFAVNKKNTKLLKELNGAIDELKKNGTYKNISEKWFGK
jgi:polar amino acid transport system substrate-binding protein